MAKKKFYVVKVGRKTGIFLTWDECKSQVDGFSGAVYKSFTVRSDAENFLNDNEKEFDSVADCVFYVDGSYEDSIKKFSYGVVALCNNEEKHFYKDFDDKSLVSMRNVAGEILGAKFAMEYAIENDMKNIEIYFDYEGIEKWAKKQWQANKEGTVAYQKFYESIKDQLNVKFVKVKGHSGDKYNDLADKLAKKALGLM